MARPEIIRELEIKNFKLKNEKLTHNFFSDFLKDKKWPFQDVKTLLDKNSRSSEGCAKSLMDVYEFKYGVIQDSLQGYPESPNKIPLFSPKHTNIKHFEYNINSTLMVAICFISLIK